jgi:hypothetical protein
VVASPAVRKLARVKPREASQEPTRRSFQS